MAPQNPGKRLSRIKTRWTMVFQAHQGQGDEGAAAQRRLLLRYHRPVYHYLRAMLRDDDAAEELTNEFAVRFLRGDFKHADPSRGRFRDLLKRALRHLAIDYWRRKRAEKGKTPAPLPDDSRLAPADPASRRAPPGAPDRARADRAFLVSWRGAMLAQAWRALARFQDQTRCPYHTVLRCRRKNLQAHSAELAREVGTRLGRPLSEAAFRQLLRRAREKFADFLVAEAARSITNPDPEAVETELIELNLLHYCRGALARLRAAD